MKRIPFDLEKALAGEKVVTRDGASVDELHFFETAKNEPIRFVYEGCILGCGLDGRMTKEESAVDLFMAPKKIEGWMNVYMANILPIRRIHSTVYLSKDEADKYALEGRIACVYVSFFEGEGL